MNVNHVPTLVNAVAWTLLHACWQVAAIHLVYALARHSVRHAAPERRYAVGLVALLAIAAALTLTLVLQVDKRVTHGGDSVPLDSDSTPLQSTVRGSGFTVDTLGRQRVAPVPEASGYDRFAVSVEPYFPLLVTAWASGCGVMSALHVVGLVGIRRLLGRCQDAGAGDAARWAGVAQRLGVRRAVRYLASAEITTPLTVGWIKPAVLLPVYVSTQFTVAQIDAMVAHELAHVRRLDYLVNQFQAVLESLLYFHPSLWLLAGRIRRDRELCCDRLAVRLSDDPRPLATALTRLAELRQAPISRLASALVTGSLVERVAALANRSARGRTNVVTLALTVLLGGGCLAAIGADVHGRATLFREVRTMRTTHESVFVADLLDVGPPRPEFRDALIAALQATRERASSDDPRFAALVDACADGADLDLVWREYLLTNTGASYPTVRSEFPPEWPFDVAGTQRKLSRTLWQHALAMPDGDQQVAFGRTALMMAAVRREYSGIPALATVVSDLSFQPVTQLGGSQVRTLQRYLSISQDALVSSIAATRKYEQALNGIPDANVAAYLPAALDCGDRFSEISFFVSAVTNAAPTGDGKRSGLNWLLIRASNDGVVQRHLALGTTPKSQSVIAMVAGE